MSSPVIAITGIAPFSLGANVARTFLEEHKHAKVIGLDILSNPTLRALSGYYEIRINLNPLDHPFGLQGFAADIDLSLKRALEGLHSCTIDILIMSSGVYGAGYFADHDVITRRNIIGVNLVSHLEVLYAVMAINTASGINNAESLACIEVGSFHGLYAGKQRSLYATSKAAGIDLCTSLSEGGELDRCYYFSPGMIDTHMLHSNHWINKSLGPEELFRAIFQDYPSVYEGIFRECEWDLLKQVALELRFDTTKILSIFEKYCRFRQDAFNSELGVTRPEECSHFLINLLKDREAHPSGVYTLNRPLGQALSAKHAKFSDLSRQAIINQSKEISYIKAH